MKSHSRGYAWAIVASVMWGFSGTLIKVCELRPMAINVGRSLIALIAVIAVTKLVRQRWSIRNILCWPVALAGFFGGVSYLSFVLSLEYLSVTSAIVISYGFMQFMPWGDLIFNDRKVGKADKVTAVLVGLGLFVVLLQNNGHKEFPGVLWGAACGLSYVLAIAIRARRPTLEIEVQVGMYSATLVLSLPFLPSLWGAVPSSWSDCWPLVVNGVIQALVMIAIFRALRDLSAATVTFVTTSDVLLAPLVAFLLLNERPATLTIIGGGVVLGGICYHYWMNELRTGPKGG